MIGFNYLGKLGQLGNQMFQYASLRGIAKNRGYDFRIPYHEEVFVDSLGNRLRIELFTPFVMSNVTADKVGMIGTNNLHDSQSIDSTVPEPHFNFSEDLIEYVNDRPGHDLRYAIDNAKIKKALNFHPQHTLEEGLTKTIIWYKYDRI